MEGQAPARRGGRSSCVRGYTLPNFPGGLQLLGYLEAHFLFLFLFLILGELEQQFSDQIIWMIYITTDYLRRARPGGR